MKEASLPHLSFDKTQRRRAFDGVCLRTLCLGAGLCLAASVFSVPTFAANLTPRGGVHETYDRIVFDFPQTTTSKLDRQGDKITITFGTEADVNFQSLIAAKISRAQNFTVVEKTTDHVTISFTLAPKSFVKDFWSGKSLVLDVAGPAEDTTPKNTPAVPAPTAAVTATPPKQEPPKLAQQPTPPKDVPAKTATPEPPVVAEHASKETPKETKTKETKIEEKPAKETPAQAAPKGKEPPALKETASPEIAQPPLKPSDVAHATPAIPVVTETAQATAPKEIVPAPLPPAGQKLPPGKKPIPIDVGNVPEEVLALDPKFEIGAAVFARGGYGYIIFDRKLNLNLKGLTANQPAPRVTLEEFDLPNNNGFRFPLSPNLDLRAMQSGTVWQIYLSRHMRENSVSGTLVAQPDFALGSRLLLSTIDPPEPVRFTDPVVGDEMLVVPLRQVDSFSIGRRYADLEVLPSAQGLAIRPLIDKLVVQKVSDGIEITKPGGLRLSPVADTGMLDKAMEKGKRIPIKTIFDLNTWAGKKRGDTFTKVRQRLTQTIVDVPENQRNRARLELARFYFAHGMGEETLGLLSYLLVQDPDLKNYPDFVAISGAAKVLENHPTEALADLTRSDLHFLPESELWQAVANVQLRDWVGAEEKFARTQNLLFAYPEPFYSKFAVYAVEAALSVNKDREAAEWITQIDTQPHRPEIEPALTYLRGVLHSKAGRQQMAEDLWRKVATSKDRLYQIRAELALIDLAVATESLTPAQAADRLDVMRFAWRGDEIELEILHRLGLFYLETGNLRSAMNVLSNALRLYPTGPASNEIHQEMIQAFHDAFLSKKGKNLAPLEALSLYQTFGELMPVGDARQAVIRNLAEQLVAIDLLDQAAALLDGLVKENLQGEEKARTATRLAAIRLLDHKPEAALTALSYGPNENLPADLANERLLMKARALSELSKEDEALALLQTSTTETAKLLRASINMHAKRWDAAAKSLLELIGTPPKNGEQLSPSQSKWLINCAVAYALAGDSAGLDRLAIDYGPVLANMPQNDAFRVLTRTEKNGQPPNLAAAQSKIAEVDLFRSFLDAYRGAPQKK